MPINYYTTLGISHAATASDIRAAFRSLAHACHPDKNAHDPSAKERFQRVKEAYDVLADPDQRRRYDNTGSADPVVLVSKRGSYELDDLLVHGDLSDLYRAHRIPSDEPLVVKLGRSPQDNDLLENESRVLRAIIPSNAAEQPHHRYFPRLLDSMRVEDDSGSRRANVLEFLPNFHSLEAVRAAFPGGVRMEHGVWMFNRILEALDAVHGRHEVIHGAIIPSHVMIYSSSAPDDSMTHGGKLVGWSCATPVGGRVPAISPTFESFYPPEILARMPVTAETDIYMAAKCALYVMGADPVTRATPTHVPDYLARFLRGCTVANQRARPGDAWALHEELAEHMAKHFGPKKYLPFDMPVRA